MITDTKWPFIAGTAIPKYTLVKFGADDDTAVLATAATDKIIGVCGEQVDVVSGDRFEAVVADVARVVLGGTVVRGDAITSDASGRGIATTTVGNRVVGVALRSGVVGDIVPVLLGNSVL